MSQDQEKPFDFKKRLKPKSYTIGIYIVGVFILLEVIALISVFTLRSSVPEIELAGPSYEETPLATPLPSPEAPLSGVGEKESSSQDEAQVPEIVATEEEIAETRILSLNQSAQDLRVAGKLDAAERELLRASRINPDHPNTLANFAMVYEARSEWERALDYWQRVVSLGGKARSTLRLAREKVLVLEQRIRQEQLAREREQALFEKPPKALVIDHVETYPNPIPQRPEQLQIDFRLSSQQDDLDPARMRIQVFLYNKLPNQNLVPAKIGARFLEAAPKWNKGNSSTLRVDYRRDEQWRSGSVSFFGYLIRLIYDDEVVDEQASPQELISIFPYHPPNSSDR